MVRIAIVDDDPYFAETVEKQAAAFFASRGESAEIWSGSGRALLDILGGRRNFEIYLLDMEMPEMDGLELAEKVKDLHPGARVILLTAYDRYALQGIFAPIF